MIIVGTEGLSHSTAAVTWAAAEAGRRRTPLRIVHIYDWDPDEPRSEIGNEYLDVTRTLANAVLAAAHYQAREVAPDAEIETEMIVGHPVSRLLEAARDAELLVLGSRGRGAVTGLLRGSVSRRLAAQAPCPVVVVRGDEHAGGPVVAGVDESFAAEHVLHTAFEAAAARGTSLVAVRSYFPPVPLWLAPMRPGPARSAEQDATERAGLAAQVQTWHRQFPSVPTETVLTGETAAEALLSASHWAQLVVVGSRDRGPVAGALLSSIGHRLMDHAECPVLISRAGPAGAASEDREALITVRRQYRPRHQVAVTS